MLDVRAPGQQRDLHIRQRRAGKHAAVALLGQVREDQALPVAVEHVLAAGGVKRQARAALGRLEQQVHLGIVTQGLKMAHALDRRRDRLLIEDAAGIDLHVHVEPLADEAFEHLDLHRAHELNMDLAQRLVPDDVQLRVLLLELAQARQKRARVHVRRQADAVGQHRLERRRHGRRRAAEPLPRIRLRQALHGAHAPGRDGLCGLEFLAGVEPDGVHLLLHGRVRPAREIRQRRAHTQLPARDLQTREAIALRIAHDLEHPRAEFRRILRRRCVTFKRREKGVHARELQPRAEQAREELTAADERAHGLVRQRAGVKILLERRLVAQGDLLRVGVGEVHTRAAQVRAQVGHERRTVRARQVHLRHEHKHRHAVAPQQLPERFRVRLHAVRAADDEHGIVEHLQRALHLGGKVHVARRVEQRDRRVAQRQARLPRKDRDAARTLERVRVQVRVFVVHAPEVADRARAVEQRLGQRRLPGVHVRQDAQNQLLHKHLVKMQE